MKKLFFLIPFLSLTLFSLNSCKFAIDTVDLPNSPPNPVISVNPNVFFQEYSVIQEGTFTYQNGVSDADGDGVTVEITSVSFDQPIDEAAFILSITIVDEVTFQIISAPPGIGTYHATLTISVSDGTDTTESTLSIPLTMNQTD